MDKGLFFFILSLTTLWLVVDEFFGQQRISQIAMKLTPNVQTPLDNVKEQIEEKKKDFKKKTEKHLENDWLYNNFQNRYGPA